MIPTMVTKLLKKVETWGASPGNSPGLARRIALTSKLCFAATIFTSSFSATMLAIGENRIALLNAPAIPISIALVWLVKTGRHRLARLGYVGLGNLIVFVLALFLGERTNFHIQFFCSVFIAQHVFETKDKAGIAFGIVLPSFLYFLLKAFLYDAIPPGVAIPVEHISLIRTFLEIVAFLIVGFGTYDFAVNFNRTEENLETAIADLKNIYQNAGIGIARVSQDGSFLQVNPRLAEILGYTVDEMQKLRFHDVTHPDDIDPSNRLVRNLTVGRLRMARIEKRYLSKDGRTIWVNLSTAPLYDRQGLFLYFVSVMEDITQQRKNEELLYAQKRVLEMVARDRPLDETLSEIVRLIEGSEQGLLGAIKMLRDGKLALGAAPSFPKSYLESLGRIPIGPNSGTCGAAAYFGRKIVSADVAGDAELWGPYHAGILALGIRSSWSTPVIATDGTVIATVNMSWPEPSEPSSRHLEIVEMAAQLIGLAIERSQAENVILDQQVKLVTASKMAALGEMAGGLAHEINNPLAVIHGRASILESLASNGMLQPSVAAETAARIKATAMRISTIVKGLRAFARDGEQDPFKRVPLASVVLDTLELSQERFRAHEIELVVPQIPETILLECRPVQLAQVLLNLLNNSHDAVRNLSQRWVRIEHELRGDDLRIAVVDSGQGIPADIRAKVMQPFFTTKEVGMGTGLGLSISRGIISSHHGNLYLDETSSNTRFVLQLPLRQRAREGSVLSV